ncbi:hypothetical protein [Granulicella arctica]|uniref:hypothetical protein n=1 Tax=Granulicella arctica TaxID=940613 RepID=UPI0021E03504|nr:hypothetical protein [Granulicella arctica]
MSLRSSLSGYVGLQLSSYVRSRRAGWVLAAAVVGALAGCRSDAKYVVPSGPMPPNTVLLSQMMQELSSQPGFTEAMLAQLNEGQKRGPALLTPALIDHMRKMILGKDWEGLNRFPGWTMREINPTVRVVGHVAGKDAKVEETATAGGAPSGPVKKASTKQMKEYLDLGPYTLERGETADLDQPSDRPGFSTEGLTSALGDGVVRGDGADPALAPLHSESQRLSEVLNRLAMNGLSGTASATASIAGGKATTPEELVQALIATGHDVVVSDARYFANFGHFHYKGQDVMMPFFINSQILIPHTTRPLLVPVSHAEYEWTIRGPKINASVAWYFGIDGKAEFRTMDELNQPWVLGRHAHEYRGADAVEVTRLTGRMMVAYAHLHMRHPAMPFGGYYGLGVCQDSVAAIEKKMTGTATLFPNTADTVFFNDPRDAEINKLIAAIPKDRAGAMPQPERIFGSLPTTDLQAITIPGLTADLVSVRSAWDEGTLRRTHGRGHRVVIGLEIFGFVLALGVVGWLIRRRR